MQWEPKQLPFFLGTERGKTQIVSGCFIWTCLLGLSDASIGPRSALPKGLCCFVRSHSFGMGSCMQPSRPSVLHAGRRKPDGVFAEVAGGLPQGLQAWGHKNTSHPDKGTVNEGDLQRINPEWLQGCLSQTKNYLRKPVLKNNRGDSSAYLWHSIPGLPWKFVSPAV